MKDAKSIYRGGDIVEAKHCDFDSSRLLGLVCPFCNEAVYLRAGTSRIGKNKTVLVNPAFCHYPGSAEYLDCERRSISGEGREEVERIKAEKRGQRLELYNKHLWDMIAFSDPSASLYAHNLNQKVVSKLGRKFADKILFLTKDTFLANPLKGETYKKLKMLTDELIGSDLKRKNALKSSGMSDNAAKWANCLACLIKSTSGQAFHWQVIQEVYEFMRARTSGYVFKNMVFLAVECEMIDLNQSFQNLELSSAELLNTIIGNIILTPWEAQIERFSNPDRKAADEKYFALLEAASKAASMGI